MPSQAHHKASCIPALVRVTPMVRFPARPQGPLRPALVAEFAAAAGHEVVELGADGVVQRRRGGLPPLLPPDLAGPGGSVLAAQLDPALEVGGGGEPRTLEAVAEAPHRVGRAEE